MLKTKYRKLSEIKCLEGNPRTIKDDSFKKLCTSIQNNPQYFEARPIILSDRTGELVSIAGNQRVKAAKHLKLKEVPTILIPNLTEAKEREIIIRDNVNNGDWDMDILDSDWGLDELNDWGLDLDFDNADHIEKEEETKEEEKIKKLWIPDCIFPSNNKYDIPTLLKERQGNYLTNPIKPYGAESRSKQGVGTYHFYVDDYRFSSIWDDPTKIINSGALSIIEPNLSLYNSTPISYGLHLIYKKRWIARYLQDSGIDIFVDLNVNPKFYKYNLLGVPKGWGAFATRGYSDNIDALLQEIEIAREISGNLEPLMVVYGGGEKVKEIAYQNNLIYIESKMNLNNGKNIWGYTNTGNSKQAIK